VGAAAGDAGDRLSSQRVARPLCRPRRGVSSGAERNQFFGAHNVAIDSRGNVFTTEVFEGKRIQKWKVVSGAPQK
jgi:hypothetical protein